MGGDAEGAAAAAHHHFSQTVSTLKLAAQRYSWRKLSSAKWSDVWFERLAFLGPQRVLVFEFPGKRTIRVEAHGLTKREADTVTEHFGGQISEAKWLTAVEPPQRPPIRVRGRLLVVSTERERTDAAAKEPETPVLLIPAGMAFGTGEHATTATCLRLLSDIARTMRDRPWDALDLGTGSGILALAARRYGAARVEASDWDPHAIRTAKENLKLNGIDKVRVRKLDVRSWVPERQWPVVLVNLYSDLLVECAATLALVTEPAGHLIFSGTLRAQEAEVVAALQGAGLELERIVRKGKWVTGIVRKK